MGRTWTLQATWLTGAERPTAEPAGAEPFDGAQHHANGEWQQPGSDARSILEQLAGAAMGFCTRLVEDGALVPETGREIRVRLTSPTGVWYTTTVRCIPAWQATEPVANDPETRIGDALESMPNLREVTDAEQD